MDKPKHVHFMGIGGSGMSAVAQIAKSQGFDVSGCDLNLETPYIDKVRKMEIPIVAGHNPKHLEGIDVLAVTPAVFYQNDTHPEVQSARKSQNLMKWQQFMGQYLHADKTLVCIAGTHGKSTTTALAGLVLEAAGLDPTVEVGASVKEWQNNVRLGNGSLFVSEADEFDNNFEFYYPQITLLNNVELDHPEYFTTPEKLYNTYAQFLLHTRSGGAIIYNSDSPGASEIINKLSSQFSQVKLIPVSMSHVQAIATTPERTQFTYHDQVYTLKIPGLHNVANSLGIIELANLLDINTSVINSVFSQFTGISRRLELVGQPRGIWIYDDYANHPTAFAASLSAIRQLHPHSRVWAIIEPHTFSRLRALLSDLPASLVLADFLIVSAIYSSRETDPRDFSGADIAAAAKHPHTRYVPEFAGIISILQAESKPKDVILIMGSGNSYKLSRQIVEIL